MADRTEAPGFPNQRRLVLLGGPAASGKSSLARAWCATRRRAVHIELGKIRGLIISGLADPQIPGRLQSEQFILSVKSCCALAREFSEDGYDVAIDDVLFPGEAFDSSWRRSLGRLEWHVAVILPTLEETLRRSSRRDKRVPGTLIRAQHRASYGWPERYRVDTTGQTIEKSLALLQKPFHLAPPVLEDWEHPHPDEVA